jgi:hypothetical protein
MKRQIVRKSLQDIFGKRFFSGALACAMIAAQFAGEMSVSAAADTRGTTTVYNTAYNYQSSEAPVCFTVSDQDAAVTANGAAVKKGSDGSFQIPAGTTSFTVTSSASPTLTLNGAKTGCLVLPAESSTQTCSGKAITFVSEKPSADVSLYLEWRDNTASKASITEASLGLGLAYSADGGKSWTGLTAAAMGSLGFTSLPAVPARTASQSSDSSWKFDFAETLPGYDRNGQPLLYRLSEANVPADYASSFLTVNGVSALCNTLVVPFSAAVKWLDSSDAYQTRAEVMDWLSSLTVTRGTILGDDAAVPVNLSDAKNEFYVTAADSGSGIWTISMPNALGYDGNDYPYTYSLLGQESLPVKEGSAVPAGSSYAASYSNTDNHASNAAALFSGGTLLEKLTGTTVFRATKKWLDEGDTAARPEATITLYRYAKGRQDYRTASPVSLAGAQLSGVKVDKTAASGAEIAVTLPSEEGKTLPLFDEDGNQYVYFVKETLTPGANANTYTQVFLNEASGDYGEPASGRDDSARYLFSGGELDNKITGTVELSAAKTWVAAARQDVKAEVEMRLAQTDPGDGTGQPVVNSSYRTETLTGFSAEITSKTAFFSGLPKYNEYGLPYKYSVSEGSVKTDVNGVLQSAAEITAGGNYLVTADGYRYRQDTVFDEASGSAAVTNTLVGNAEIVISKSFPEGLLGSTDTSITYTIYRNDEILGTKAVTYRLSEHPEVPFTPDSLTVTSYEDLTTNPTGGAGLLPRYDGQGAEYRYSVAETVTPDGIYSQNVVNSRDDAVYRSGSYENEHYLKVTAAVTNSKPGSGIDFSVYKNWIDDGDELYHSTVFFALQYNNGADWETAVTGSIPTDARYARAAVPEQYEAAYRSWAANHQPADGEGAFRLTETKLGDSIVVPNSGVDPGVNPEHETETVSVNGRAQNWSFVSTPNQNYDVSPEASYDEMHEGRSWTFTLTNKRVGVEKITLTKIWKDGGNENGTRPADIVFTVTASEAVFGAGSTKDFVVTAPAGGEHLVARYRLAEKIR